MPEGVLEDDGADRGLVGAFIGAHLERRFEFIKAEWVNAGNFIGYPGEKDPVAGHHGGTGSVTIPEKPVRRRLQAHSTTPTSTARSSSATRSSTTCSSRNCS
ncbi:hypothetical protein OHA19_18325 [Streptomyces sp. NBC_00012]|uniref:hypothetical protein n=1 Tax=Streptomyces sp. NBC_00012 TaxID=2975621 RepID=UPI003248D690